MNEIENFQVGQIESYKFTFEYNNIRYDEYIHCKVLEVLEMRGDDPHKIKVLQIHNYQDFILNRNTYDNYTERILKVDNLDAFPNSWYTK